MRLLLDEMWPPDVAQQLRRRRCSEVPFVLPASKRLNVCRRLHPGGLPPALYRASASSIAAMKVCISSACSCVRRSLSTNCPLASLNRSASRSQSLAFCLGPALLGHIASNGDGADNAASFVVQWSAVEDAGDLGSAGSAMHDFPRSPKRCFPFERLLLACWIKPYAVGNVK